LNPERCAAWGPEETRENTKLQNSPPHPSRDENAAAGKDRTLGSVDERYLGLVGQCRVNCTGSKDRSRSGLLVCLELGLSCSGRGKDGRHVLICDRVGKNQLAGERETKIANLS